MKTTRTWVYDLRVDGGWCVRGVVGTSGAYRDAESEALDALGVVDTLREAALQSLELGYKAWNPVKRADRVQPRKEGGEGCHARPHRHHLQSLHLQQHRAVVLVQHRKRCQQKHALSITNIPIAPIPEETFFNERRVMVGEMGEKRRVHPEAFGIVCTLQRRSPSSMYQLSRNSFPLNRGMQFQETNKILTYAETQSLDTYYIPRECMKTDSRAESNYYTRQPRSFSPFQVKTNKASLGVDSKA